MRIEKYSSQYQDDVYNLFYSAVHETCYREYSAEALSAWAPAFVDVEAWCADFLKTYSLVALSDDGALLGFGNIDVDKHYIDRLYVSSSHQGEGIGRAILQCLEATVSGAVTVFASDTAKPFFIRMGYEIVRDNYVKRKGIIIHNNLMSKML